MMENPLNEEMTAHLCNMWAVDSVDLIPPEFMARVARVFELIRRTKPEGSVCGIQILAMMIHDWEGEG